MGGLWRKILITSDPNALVLRNVDKSPEDVGKVSIQYESSTITTSSNRGNEAVHGTSIEVYGVIGILNLVSSSYLLAITSQQQAATVRGEAIYAVNDVISIPLVSQQEARKAIDTTKRSTRQEQEPKPSLETDESDAEHEAEDGTAVSDTGERIVQQSKQQSSSGTQAENKDVPKDASQSTGQYGRFANRWFTKSGWKNDAKSKPPPSGESNAAHQNEETDTAPNVKTSEVDKNGQTEDDTISGPPSKHESKMIDSLRNRISRNGRLLFSSSGFYYSYDCNISKRVTHKDDQDSGLPLWKHFDESYFWNLHLLSPFIEAGIDHLILPLMQGFVGQRPFVISKSGEGSAVVATADLKLDASDTSTAENIRSDSAEIHQFWLTLISRRSVKRAGLRYTRRGVDDYGNVANDVETEQILSLASSELPNKTFSLVQHRGSIPLHFSQSPYSLKPTPTIYGSEHTNQTALEKHFKHLSQRYGVIQVVSLVDKHPPEKLIGGEYEKYVQRLNKEGGLNGEEIKFEWFDFHNVCKGMKFENVSILIGTLEDTLRSFGWTAEQDENDSSRQSGILRTNCMDCLDRSNVVQSAVAGWALEQQLSELGLSIDLRTDPETQWFNTLWADNGDAISKQYAGTAALKGDFTRTRKRNWAGALSDFSLTMNRYYNNIFSDYFMQTCIDYYLGKAGPEIFDDFETNMMSKDYSLDIQQVRQSAIDTSIKIVIEDPDEKLVSTWTLSCPRESNTLRTLPFEECVVLLTEAAMYFCRFDYKTEKVSSFERIDLISIVEIWRGAYITSSLGPTNLDERKNYGFAIRYKITGNALIRRNTRSLQNEGSVEDEKETKKDQGQEQSGAPSDDTRFLAFKALPIASFVANPEKSSSAPADEAELVSIICRTIRNTIQTAISSNPGNEDDKVVEGPTIKEKDIVSVGDARKSTGYVESMGYSLKKLVWS